MNETNDKMVSHPAHYQSKTGLEVFDVIEAFTSDLEGIEAFDAGNIIKYICRWKHKNGLQDLKKAREYLDHLIKHIEKPLKEDNDISNPNPQYTYNGREIWFTDIVFETRLDAENAIERLLTLADLYTFANVTDLYDIANIKGPLTDSKYGWTETQLRSVKPLCTVDGKYVLSLPKPIIINTKEND